MSTTRLVGLATAPASGSARINSRRRREPSSVKLFARTDRTAGWATRGSPSPRPSPLGRGRMVHSLSITPVPEFAQQPLAKHQPDACCSLSLRERVRVRGKSSVAHAKCSISQGFLSIPGWLSLLECARSFCHRCIRMTLAGVVLVVYQGRAQESDYIVADAVGRHDASYQAATRLAAHRSAIIVPLDLKNLNAFRDALRQKPPRYVAVVIRPEELDYDLARRFLVMATQLDDDPFVDFSYGFITGVTAEEALAFVERSIKSEEAHREPDLGSISVGESTRSMEVPGTFPSRNKSIAHLQGCLAGPQQLQNQKRDTQFIKMFLPKLQG